MELGLSQEEHVFHSDEEYLADIFLLESIRLRFFYNGELAGLEERPRSVSKFLPTADEISYVLDKKIAQPEEDQDVQLMRDWEDYFRERCMVSKEAGIVLTAEKLSQALGLTELGRSALALALLASADGEFRPVFQFLQGDVDKTHPTLEFICRVFFHQKDKTIAELFRHGEEELQALSRLFPVLITSDNPYNEQLIPDRRLLSILLGEGNYYPPHLDCYLPDAQLEPIFFREAEMQLIQEYIEPYSEQILFLFGAIGSGKKHLLRHYCHAAQQAMVCCQLMPSDEEFIDQNKKIILQTALREALYQQAPLVIGGLEQEKIAIQKQIIAWLKQEAASYCSAVFVISSEENHNLGAERILRIELPALDENQRGTIWQYYAQEEVLAPEIDLSTIANTFDFTPGQIGQALQAARLRTGLSSKAISKETLYQACYSLADHRLAEKAKRVRSNFVWDDLKLAVEDKEVLRDICNRVKNKHIVMSEWGFAGKLPYGGGLSAVFAGPPGTGKTMAAQVIANELHMELYQIDLSQVVDKYIGETEKNIRLIFDEARRSNSILFFDEADALFGKRVEASTSNDRFANIESSLLLQCIEEYSGISLLATNNYSAIDSAFVRRFKYLINFRMPDAGLRLQIWESVFPQQVPLSEEVEFSWLAAQFPLTGAYIKNVALAAAFLAAEDGTKVEMIHIFKGLKREILKEGRMLEPGQLGSFGYLFPDI